MDNERKARMRLRQFSSYIQLFKIPCNKMEFYDSEWRVWLERISTSETIEKKQIESWIEESDDAEWYAEDFGIVDETSWSMYAALIVSLWSKIDHYLKLSCKYIALKENSQFDGWDFVKYKDYINTYKNNPDYFSSLENYITLNFIRILNNTFKHSNGRYKQPVNKPWDILDVDLSVRYGIDKIVSDETVIEGKIPYENISFQELIIDAGIFCEKLINDIG